MINSKLEGAGRPDIKVETRSVTSFGHRPLFELNVEVGPGLSVCLMPREGHTIEQQLSDCATALIKLKESETTLAAYVGELSEICKSHIDAARDNGLDLAVEHVGLGPSFATDVADTSNDPAGIIHGMVVVRHTSFALSETATSLFVESPADLKEKLATLMEDQRRRQLRIEEIQAHSADLVIDEITLALLEAHSIDPVPVLHEVLRSGYVELPVSDGDRSVQLKFRVDEGRVLSSFELGAKAESLRMRGWLPDRRSVDILQTSFAGQAPPWPDRRSLLQGQCRHPRRRSHLAGRQLCGIAVVALHIAQAGRGDGAGSHPATSPAQVGGRVAGGGEDVLASHPCRVRGSRRGPAAMPPASRLMPRYRRSGRMRYAVSAMLVARAERVEQASVWDIGERDRCGRLHIRTMMRNDDGGRRMGRWETHVQVVGVAHEQPGPLRLSMLHGGDDPGRILAYPGAYASLQFQFGVCAQCHTEGASEAKEAQASSIRHDAGRERLLIQIRCLRARRKPVQARHTRIPSRSGIMVGIPVRQYDRGLATEAEPKRRGGRVSISRDACADVEVEDWTCDGFVPVT